MTALTGRQRAWIRAEIGNSISDEDLDGRYARLESVRDVVIEALRQQRTALLESPLTASIDGVASVSNAENVKAIERRIAALVKLDDDPSDDPPVPDGDIDTPEPERHYQLVRTRGR